ncbi:hypothetical protein J3E69DRAFT_367410 [Trichoderma sp. SZMC 28015]
MEYFKDVENVWPSDMPSPPSPPPLPSPKPSPPPEPEREPIPWQTLQALEDERLAIVSSVIRELMYGHMYAHLSNVNVDWDLEGSAVCRVEGTRCHGDDFEEPYKLQEHLRTSYHLTHNATQIPRQRTPPPGERYTHIRQEVQAQITQSYNVATTEAKNNEIAPLSAIPGSQGSITLPFTNSAGVFVQECSGFQETDDKHVDDSDSINQDGGLVQALEDEQVAIPGSRLRVLTAWDSSGRNLLGNEHIYR